MKAPPHAGQGAEDRVYPREFEWDVAAAFERDQQPALIAGQLEHRRGGLVTQQQAAARRIVDALGAIEPREFRRDAWQRPQGGGGPRQTYT